MQRSNGLASAPPAESREALQHRYQHILLKNATYVGQLAYYLRITV
jgi:hypothetical protein